MTTPTKRRRHVFSLVDGDSNTKRCSRCGATRLWVKWWAGWTDTELNGQPAPLCLKQGETRTESA